MALIEARDFIRSVLHKDVEFITSEVHGNGLFAKSDIKKGISLHVTHVHKELVNYTDSSASWVNLIPNNQYNHSKENENCKIVTDCLTKGLVTIRDVCAGEELLVDYTKDYELEQPDDDWKS